VAELSEQGIDALKADACAEVDRLASRLIEVSHDLHAHPELNYQERYAHDRLCAELEQSGLSPTRHAFGVDTAFRADAGAGGYRVAVLLEYDALPEIGHACGHNIIAAAGLGAGLALAALTGRGAGSVAILGTPAEEGGGGKILMARNGAFDDVDAAMMVHPADADLIRIDAIAVQQVEASYNGVAAHAAAAPQEGRNALDAAVLGYLNVAALRQHIAGHERLHGIFTAAGDKPSIVPKHAATHWFVRSGTIASLQPLKARVSACLEAGALASGCSCTLLWEDHTYSDMRDNGPMVEAYCANAERLGRQVRDPLQVGRRVVGSTDMGNVSYLVPSIHPMIKVAPDGVPIHTTDFARWAASAEGDLAVLDGAKILAMTAIDLWKDPELRRRTAEAFGPQGPDRSVLAR
jgi:amidohydrolase